MSARRAERLVNLVICLLATRQYLPADRIRTAVPGYEPDDGTARADEAFKRMFERDKTDLRDLGVPLETGRARMSDSEDGYRIARRDYELPDIDLTADEAAAVGLAARLWQSAGLAEASHGALRKLRAAGIDVDESATRGIEPAMQAGDAAFTPCVDAVRRHQPVRFGYRRPGRTGAPVPREVEPWGVVSWRGRWYLVGHDRLREAPRCFRLSRIDGPIQLIGAAGDVTPPRDVDLAAIVAASQAPHRPGVARVRVRPGAAAGLRRVAERISPGGEGDHDVLEIPYADPATLADRIVGHGAAVLVLDPPEVRAAVIARLRAAAENVPGDRPSNTAGDRP